MIYVPNREGKIREGSVYLLSYRLLDGNIIFFYRKNEKSSEFEKIDNPEFRSISRMNEDKIEE